MLEECKSVKIKLLQNIILPSFLFAAHQYVKREGKHPEFMHEDVYILRDHDFVKNGDDEL